MGLHSNHISNLSDPSYCSIFSLWTQLFPSTTFSLQTNGSRPLSSISAVQPEVHLHPNHQRSALNKQISGPHCSPEMLGGGTQESACLMHDVYAHQSLKTTAFSQRDSPSTVLRPAAFVSPGNSRRWSPVICLNKSSRDSVHRLLGPSLTFPLQ